MTEAIRMPHHATKPAEDIFCSRLRLKILKTLFQLDQLNASDIAHRLHVNYQIVTKHLSVLVDTGIVQSRLCGRTHLFRFSSSQRALAVQKVLETWENEVNQPDFKPL